MKTLLLIGILSAIGVALHFWEKHQTKENPPAATPPQDKEIWDKDKWA